MKTIEQLNKIRVEKRIELDLRKNTNADTREKHILVCNGTGCTSSKSPQILDNFRKIIEEKGIKNVKVIKTGCFGLCAKGPIVIIRPEDTFYAMVKPEDCEEIIQSHIIDGKIVERLLCKDVDGKIVNKLDDLTFYKKQKRIALKNCGVINPEDIDEYIAFDGYRALARVLVEMTPDEVIQTIDKSGLRGRGGAGFPTGKKWRSTKDAVGEKKFVVCNADEGDPGAFMDRSIYDSVPARTHFLTLMIPRLPSAVRKRTKWGSSPILKKSVYLPSYMVNWSKSRDFFNPSKLAEVILRLQRDGILRTVVTGALGMAPNACSLDLDGEKNIQ